MKKILLIALLVFSANSFGQKLTDSLLVGTWRAEKVVRKPSNPNYRDFIDSFKAATIKLNADKTFEINTSENSQEFATIRKQTKGKSWKFDPITNSVKVGDAKDNFSTMKFKVKTVEGKTIFAFEETYQNIEIEVSKYEAPKK